jgi:hypothetical protein
MTGDDLHDWPDLVRALQGQALLLAHRRDRGEYSDIAVVPIATELASRQLVVTEPFSAKVSDSHAAAKMEERIVRTDRNSACVHGIRGKFASINADQSSRCRHRNRDRILPILSFGLGGSPWYFTKNSLHHAGPDP